MSFLSDAKNLALDAFTALYGRKLSVDTKAIIRAIGESTNPPAAASPDGGTGVLAVTRTQTSGTIAAGAAYVNIKNTGLNDATVAGATLKSGESLAIPTAWRMLLPAIAYNPLTSELYIVSLRPPA